SRGAGSARRRRHDARFPTRRFTHRPAPCAQISGAAPLSRLEDIMRTAPLCLVLVLALLVGCGSPPSEPAQTAVPAAAKPKGEVAKAKEAPPQPAASAPQPPPTSTPATAPAAAPPQGVAASPQPLVTAGQLASTRAQSPTSTSPD